MLRRKKPALKGNNDFCVLDIENLPNGTVIAIGFGWRENDVLQHRVFSTWEEWWEWLIPQCKQHKRFRTIYAHNGGGWDWLSFLQWFITNRDRLSKTSVGLIEAQSSLVYLEVGFTCQKGTENEHSRSTIKLCDSLYLLRSPLNDLARKILGSENGKTESNIESVWDAWRNDKPRFYEYVRQDCDLLVRVLEKTLELIREKIAPIDKLGITIGGLAMNVYRTIWSKRDAPIYTDLPDDVEAFCRKGYHGGRVEVFKHGYYPDIRVYDINSLYPSAMVNTTVPVSSRGLWTTRLYNLHIGCYQVQFNQKKRDIPPVLLGEDGNGAYEGSGVFYSPELRLLREVDPKADIEIERGWVFTDCGKIFDEFVGTLYALRQSADSDPAVSLLAKYLLNSLYGKWAQRGDREKLVVFDSLESAYAAELDVMRYNKEVDEYNTTKPSGHPSKSKRGLEPLNRDEENSMLWKETEQVRVEHAHVAIAGVITSQARCQLYKGILAGIKTGTIVYVDTDSVHTTGRLPSEIVGNGLGQFKLETVGDVRYEGVYVGKKLYDWREVNKPMWTKLPDGKWKRNDKLRAKGISLQRSPDDPIGADLTFEKLVALLDGGMYNCKFARPATFRGVLNNAQSCSLGSVKRQRRVRMT